MRPKFTGLWQNPNFMKLWGAETLSVFGSQVSFLAIPLTAVIILKASPFEMGILGVLETGPFLLLSLFVGVWADRLPRRLIMIVADIGRAVMLGILPLAYLMGWLSMGYLYLSALIVGILTVFFDISYQAYLPDVITRSELVEGNSKLEVSRSLAQVTGPGLGGVLVQVLTAPIAVLVDAISFAASAICLSFISKPASVITAPPVRRSMFKDIGEGLGIVFKNPVLRSIAGCTSTSNLFSQMAFAILTLFLVRELGMDPAQIGIIFGIGAVGALCGALLTTYITRWLKVGWTIIGASLFFGLGGMVLPFSTGNGWQTVAGLAAGFFILQFGNPVYNITQVSLRQALTPNRLQGRMNASMRFIVWGTMPIGSFIGGVLGEIIGLRGTMLVAALGATLATGWVLFSPVRTIKVQPEPVDEAATSTFTSENLPVIKVN